MSLQGSRDIAVSLIANRVEVYRGLAGTIGRLMECALINRRNLSVGCFWWFSFVEWKIYGYIGDLDDFFFEIFGKSWSILKELNGESFVNYSHYLQMLNP